MTQILHRLADADTPVSVEVPKTKYGLALWAIGRFGGSIIVCAVCLYALNIVYGNMMDMTQRMLTMLEARAVADTKHAAAMDELTGVIEAMSRELETHRRLHSQ
jgi:hypothetical protein